MGDWPNYRTKRILSLSGENLLKKAVEWTQRLTAALKGSRHLRGDRVLCLPDGSPITRDRMIKAVGGAQRVADILGHTFYSHLAVKGAPARAIQELAGHADLSTTQRYMHRRQRKNAIRLLGDRQSRVELAENAAPGTNP